MKNGEGLERDAAYYAALRFIKYRQRSVLEVRKKLSVKGYSPDTADEIIKRLEEEGYLSDFNFARAWAMARFFNRNLGPRRIEYELRNKGISGDIIEEIIEEIKGKEDIPENAVKFLKEKYRYSLKDIPDIKIIKVLIRNGFSITDAREAIKRIKPEFSR
jgi:regulatory protein